jgi:BirA family biotin operon repressor/biotin-[acetyl-CoA-carboxylase] ligase
VLLDGRDAETLARQLSLPRVHLYDEVASTMDEAHALAQQGASAGTLVVADRQSAGRGRGGRRWSSRPGDGLWCTLLERPNDADAVEVLSLRLGLRAARVLDRWAGEPVRLKWPNDLFVRGGKLAGILVEARWRAQRPDWVAIGVGVNLRVPEAFPEASSLVHGVTRVDVLAELVPALRAAASARGALTDAELDAWHERDAARGRRCTVPAAGEVTGIGARGELLVLTADGERAFRGGSLRLEGHAP